MRKKYEMRTAYRADGASFKLRVYESLQHIWDEVHWTVSPSAIKRLRADEGEIYKSEKGARIYFEEN